MAVDNDENFLPIYLFFSFSTFCLSYSTAFQHSLSTVSVKLADFIYSCRQSVAV